MVAIMKDGKLIQTDTPEQMSAHPADEYVEAFINNADKSKVLSVHNIMITPKALIKEDDGVDHAIRVMKKNELSTVYVVDTSLQLAGIPVSYTHLSRRLDHPWGHTHKARLTDQAAAPSHPAGRPSLRHC